MLDDGFVGLSSEDVVLLVAGLSEMCLILDGIGSWGVIVRMIVYVLYVLNIFRRTYFLGVNTWHCTGRTVVVIETSLRDPWQKAAQSYCSTHSDSSLLIDT